MKTTRVFAVALLFIALILALIAASFNQPASAQNTSANFPALQITPTPPAEDDLSVIGSTDGIVAMGVIITLIVIAPVLFRNKKK